VDYIKITKDVLKTEADELYRCANRLDESINKAVRAISVMSGKLIVMGVGKSGLVGGKIAATFASTGTPSFFIHPTEAMHGDLGMLQKNDMILAISNSGESEELVLLLPHIKRFGVKIIAFCGNKNSSLAKYADIFIDISIKKEACPLNIAPTSSTTLTMALGDALAVALMKEKNFKREDFASFHPGGSLGKRLFVRAIDLAVTKNLPIISKDANLKEAIEVMTKAKLGTVLIVEDQKVVALLSDGDLRRALMDSDFSLKKSAIKYATKNPKSAHFENLLASQALKIIEDNKIQLLILTNKDDKLKGILHIHALVEAGIS